MQSDQVADLKKVCLNFNFFFLKVMHESVSLMSAGKQS